MCVKTDESDILYGVIYRQELRYCTNRNSRCLVYRITIGASADRRKSHSARTIFYSKTQSIPITIRQQFCFAESTAMPYGTDRVYHPFGGQTISSGNDSFSRIASSYPSAFSKQLRTGSPMYGAVYASSPKQAAVCRVDNGIYTFQSYVTLHHTYSFISH
jgi:hypothetical protein